MPETRWTPGPWECAHRETASGMHSTQVFTPDGRAVATLHWYPRPPTEDGVVGTYREANAHLIAESPAMYEALEEAEAGLEVAVSMLAGRTGDWEGSSPRKALAMVRAALARARGEGT